MHAIVCKTARCRRIPSYCEFATHTIGIRYSHVRALSCSVLIRDRHQESGDSAGYTRAFKSFLSEHRDASAAGNDTVVGNSGQTPTRFLGGTA